MEDKAEDRAGADGEQAGIKSEGGGRINRGLVEGNGRDMDGSEIQEGWRTENAGQDNLGVQRARLEWTEGTGQRLGEVDIGKEEE